MGQEATCLGNCVGCEYVNVGLCQENREGKGRGQGRGQRGAESIQTFRYSCAEILQLNIKMLLQAREKLQINYFHTRRLIFVNQNESKQRRRNAFHFVQWTGRARSTSLFWNTEKLATFYVSGKGSYIKISFPPKVKPQDPNVGQVFGVLLENSAVLFSRVGLPLLCTLLSSNIFSELLLLQHFYLLLSEESLFCRQQTLALFNCTIYFPSINAAAIVNSWRHK